MIVLMVGAGAEPDIRDHSVDRVSAGDDEFGRFPRAHRQPFRLVPAVQEFLERGVWGSAGHWGR